MSGASAENMHKEAEVMGTEGRIIRCLHPVFMVGGLAEGEGGAEGGDKADRGMYASTDIRRHDGSGDTGPAQRNDRRGKDD